MPQTNMMRFIDYCGKVLKGKTRSAKAPAQYSCHNDGFGVNPLASLHVPCPPTPNWKDLRAKVLLHASKLAREDELASRTAIIERAQFATAMALFIVIACCILGLLLPVSLGGDTMLASSPDKPMVPVLASYQHP